MSRCGGIRGIIFGCMMWPIKVDVFLVFLCPQMIILLQSLTAQPSSQEMRANKLCPRMNA